LTGAIQVTCNGSPTQQWSLKPVTGGHQIVSVANARLCLTLRGATVAQGARVWLTECSASGQPGEVWKIEPLMGANRVVATHSNLCLNVSQSSALDGASILQWGCQSNGNGMWSFEK